MFGIPTLYLYAALGIGLLGAGWYLHHKGYSDATALCQATNNAAIAESNAKAVQEWKDSTAAQAAKDDAKRKSDAEADAASAAKLQALIASGSAILAKIKANPPPAKCELSPAWVEQFNSAR